MPTLRSRLVLVLSLKSPWYVVSMTCYNIAVLIFLSTLS